MLKSMKRNPLKHIEKNLAFSIDGSCSSVYEVNGFDMITKMKVQKAYYRNQLALFTHQEYDVQFLVIPRTTDCDEIIDQHIATLKGPTAPTGHFF